MKTDTLSTRIHHAIDQVAPLLNGAADDAHSTARQSLHAMQDRTLQLREAASRTGEIALGVIRNQPFKAMLMAAAAGAVLLGVFKLLSRSRTR